MLELIPLSQIHLHPVKTSACLGEHLFVVSKSLRACISPEVELWLLDPRGIFCYPPSKQFDGCKQHSSTGRSLQPQQRGVQIFNFFFWIWSNICIQLKYSIHICLSFAYTISFCVQSDMRAHDPQHEELSCCFSVCRHNKKLHSAEITGYKCGNLVGLYNLFALGMDVKQKRCAPLTSHHHECFGLDLWPQRSHDALPREPHNSRFAARGTKNTFKHLKKKAFRFCGLSISLRVSFELK